MSGVGLVNVDVLARSRAVGDLPTLTRHLGFPILSARLGASVLFHEHVGVDLAGSFSPIGFERASLLLGVIVDSGVLEATPPRRPAR